MSISSFKSTTKRSSIGGVDDTTSSSSGGQRRTSSVSHFSHRLPSELSDFESNTPLPLNRRKFVKTFRGSRFSAISLDDLAIQLSCSGERGWSSEIYSSETVAEKRRGRSVSRQTSSGKSVKRWSRLSEGQIALSKSSNSHRNRVDEKEARSATKKAYNISKVYERVNKAVTSANRAANAAKVAAVKAVQKQMNHEIHHDNIPIQIL